MSTDKDKEAEEKIAKAIKKAGDEIEVKPALGKIKDRIAAKTEKPSKGDKGKK